MSKFLVLFLLALISVQAAPVMISRSSLDERGRGAEVQGFFKKVKKFFKKAAKVVKKIAPAVIPFLPGGIGIIAKAALPILTGSGPLGSRLVGAGKSLLGSGLLPPGISNIANKALNVYQGFKNGGIGGAISAATGGQGLGSLVGGTAGKVINQVAGHVFGGGGGLPGTQQQAQQQASMNQAMQQAAAQQAAQQQAAAQQAAAQQAAAQQQAAGQQGAANQGAGQQQQQVAATNGPVAQATTAPKAPSKPIPTVKGNSSGAGSPSKLGNPAEWKGHAIDPMHVMSGTRVTGIKGGSGDAAKGFEMKGRYGHLKVQADGTWDYLLDEKNALVRAYGEKPNALFDVFALEFSGTAPAQKDIRIHVWEHFKKNP